ncbi:UNVERIFIED_ORG: hypothetical protein CLV66_101577 [Actinomadura viridilutea]
MASRRSARRRRRTARRSAANDVTTGITVCTSQATAFCGKPRRRAVRRDSGASNRLASLPSAAPATPPPIRAAAHRAPPVRGLVTGETLVCAFSRGAPVRSLRPARALRRAGCAPLEPCRGIARASVRRRRLYLVTVHPRSPAGDGSGEAESLRCATVPLRTRLVGAECPGPPPPSWSGPDAAQSDLTTAGAPSAAGDAACGKAVERPVERPARRCGQDPQGLWKLGADGKKHGSDLPRYQTPPVEDAKT